MLAGSLLILLLVGALIAAAFYARREAADERRLLRVWIIGLGLAFPLATLVALLAYGLVIGERLLPQPSLNVVAVRAEGSRWTWTFGYAEAPGLVTRNVLHIPAGRPVDVSITTADVIHSFWVPRLAGKLDAIPGRINVLRLRADEPGRYLGVSGEFSGTGYLGHRFVVIALEEAAWQRFIAGGSG